jgi:hypothetical protein
MKVIKPTRRKQITIVLILIFIIISSYSVIIVYHYGIFRDEQRGYPISVRVSNVNWKIENYTIEQYPDQTPITFMLEMEVWVDGTSNVSYMHPDAGIFHPGFKSSFTGFKKVIMEPKFYAQGILEGNYPPGSSFFSREITVWINRKNIINLPNGLFDFWFGLDDYDTANIYHTYLRKSVFDLKISHDPMPEEWGDIDWNQNEWGPI